MVRLSIALMILLLGFDVWAAKEQKLFSILRSKNKNEVVYSAKTDSKLKFSKSDPIASHWIMHESGGNKEDLNFIEKKTAYGVDVKSNTPSKVVFSVSALPERPITVQKSKNSGTLKAMLLVNGRPAYLEKIFVKTDESGMMPKVLLVELTGIDIQTGKKAIETVTP